MILHAVSAVAALAVVGGIGACLVRLVLLADNHADRCADRRARRRQHRADNYSGARWAEFTDAARKASRR